MEENENKPAPTTIGDDIKEFNVKIDELIEKLHDWKLQTQNALDGFVGKLSEKTSGLKIK